MPREIVIGAGVSPSQVPSIKLVMPALLQKAEAVKIPDPEHPEKAIEVYQVTLQLVVDAPDLHNLTGMIQGHKIDIEAKGQADGNL